MAVYSTYAQYTTTYKGTAIASADFDRLAARASEYIDQMTMDRAATETVAANIAKLMLATCAVAEELQTLEAAGGQSVQSESTGRNSITYFAPMTATGKISQAAKRHLWNTGLMFRGFADGEYTGSITEAEEIIDDED
jgi:hypothetical protein